MKEPKPMGRPPKPPAEKFIKRCVSFTPEDHALALRLGGGNLSAGVREALKQAQSVEALNGSLSRLFDLVPEDDDF